jgi:hypothetical protein
MKRMKVAGCRDTHWNCPHLVIERRGGRRRKRHRKLERRDRALGFLVRMRNLNS